MKNYTTPCIDFIFIESSDVITASLGTETSILDENDGSWDLDINIK